MPAEPWSLSEATVATRVLIARRKLRLRIVTVTAGLLVVMGITAFPFAHLAPLAAFLGLFWVWVAYVTVDTWLVFCWRRRLLATWCGGEINLAVFAGAMETLPTLPRATLAALLRGVPRLDPTADRDLTRPERARLAALCRRRWMREAAPVLLVNVLIGLALTCGAALLRHFLRAG